MRSEPRPLGAGIHFPSWVRVKSVARTLKAMVECSTKGQKGKAGNNDVLERHHRIVPIYISGGEIYSFLAQYRDRISGWPTELWPINHFVRTVLLSYCCLAGIPSTGTSGIDEKGGDFGRRESAEVTWEANGENGTIVKEACVERSRVQRDQENVPAKPRAGPHRGSYSHNPRLEVQVQFSLMDGSSG